MPRSFMASIAAILILGSAPATMLAQTRTWSGSVSTDWGNASNWSPAAVPTSADSVIIPLVLTNNPSTSGVTGAACLDLDVQSGGSLTVSPGFPLEINGAATIQEPILGSGLLRFVGTGGTLSTGALAVLPNVTIDGASVTTSGAITIGGDLTVTSGTLTVPNGSTVTVSGGTSVLGGTITGGSSGVVEVVGSVTYSGGSVSGSVTIKVQGNWTSPSGAGPAAGTVQFLPPTPPATSTISGASTSFNNLVIAVNAVVDATVNVTINGSLDLAGTLNSTGGAQISVNGPVLVPSTGVFDVGAATHTFSSNLNHEGTVNGTGTIVFDGTTNFTGTGTLRNVQLAGTAYTMGGDLTIAGNLNMQSGTMNFDVPARTVTITGDSTFTAPSGSFTGAIGTLVVDGDVTFSGMPVTQMPNITVRGDWSADAVATPTTGTVTFDGTILQTVTGTKANFHSVVVNPGVNVAGVTSITTTGTLTVDGQITMIAFLGILELQTDDVFTLNGTLALVGQDTTLDANSTVDLMTSSTLNLGTQTHTFAGDVNVDGAISPTGVMQFDGTTNLSATTALPEIEISGGTVTTTTAVQVNGPVTVTSGSLNVQGGPLSATQGVTVGSGGSVSTSGGGAVQISGPVNGFAATGTVDLEVSGNWTTGTEFQPTGGTITFNGTIAQTVSSAGGAFFNLIIVAGSNVTSLASLEVGGFLQVDGSLTMPATEGPGGPCPGLCVTGNATVNPGGALDIGGNDSTFGADLTANGSLAGNAFYELTGTGTYTGMAALPNLRVSAGSATLGTVTITGSFELTGGAVLAAAATVGGSASFLGGVVQLPSGATSTSWDCAGDVTFNGAVATLPIDVDCGGSWVADSQFAPTSGTVTLDGAGPGVGAATAGGAMNFNNLIVRDAVRALTNDPVITAGVITVEGTGGLDIPAGASVALTMGTVTVIGQLSLAEGATLALGAVASVTIDTVGSLALQGSFGNPAVVTGHMGGGYVFDINGSVSAGNFRFEQPGAGGVLLAATAVIAPAPNDFRAGVFSDPAGAPAAVLLHVERSAATDFRYVDFEDPLGVGLNVRRLNPGPAITFTNSEGNLSGPAFEDDPLGIVDWPPDEITLLTSFTATPAVLAMDLAWQASIEVDADAYILERADGTMGNFAQVHEVTTAGAPTLYAFTDPSLAAQSFTYRLSQRLTHGEVIELSTTVATPLPFALPPNVLTVGPSGAFPDIQAAIGAVTSPLDVIAVAPGTYASFGVNGPLPPQIPGFAGSSLRIMADGTGPVVIDTTAQPVAILNTGLTETVVLDGLIIGSSSSTFNALVVQNCLGLVIVDDCEVHGGAGLNGLRMVNCRGVAIQRCTLTGTPGLQMLSNSNAAASLGSTDSVGVAGGSILRTMQFTITTGGGGPIPGLLQFPGTMPDLDLDEFVVANTPMSIPVTADPNVNWFVFVTLSTTWLDILPAPTARMVVLMDPGGMVLGLTPLFAGTTDVLGMDSIALPLGIPPIWGVPISMQLITLNPSPLELTAGTLVSTVPVTLPF